MQSATDYHHATLSAQQSLSLRQFELTAPQSTWDGPRAAKQPILNTLTVALTSTFWNDRPQQPLQLTTDRSSRSFLYRLTASVAFSGGRMPPADITKQHQSKMSGSHGLELRNRHSASQQFMSTAETSHK